MPHDPMNAQTTHPKLKLSMTLSSSTFPAGSSTHPISGKLTMESLASASTSSSSSSPNNDKTLGIGIIMVELFAIQELISRDHSATSTFLHMRRVFQGPGLPPSNAVRAIPEFHPGGKQSMPEHYYPALRGLSTFLFRIPIPETSPSSISFANGQARVRYELRASVGVWWKGERRLVVERIGVDIVGAFPYHELLLTGAPIPEADAVVVGENGKVWMQGKVLGGVLVSGASACLELQVKNHSARKNSSLTLSVSRTLYLPSTSSGPSTSQKVASTPINLTDTLVTVPFRGAEYIIPPGAEGVANLVFDVPKAVRGVRGGVLEGEEEDIGEGGEPGKKMGGRRKTEALFEIRCKVEVRLGMGMGSKDIVLEIPIETVHPRALPPPNEIDPYLSSPGVLQQLQHPQMTGYPQVAGNPYHQHPQHSAYPGQHQVPPQMTGLPGLGGIPTHLTGVPTGYPQSPMSPIPSTPQAYYNHPSTSPAPTMPLPYVDPTSGQVWLPPPGPPRYADPYAVPLQPPQLPYSQGYTGHGPGTPPRAVSPHHAGLPFASHPHPQSNGLPPRGVSPSLPIDVYANLAPPPPIGSGVSARPRSAAGRSLPVPPVSPGPMSGARSGPTSPLVATAPEHPIIAESMSNIGVNGVGLDVGSLADIGQAAMNSSVDSIPQTDIPSEPKSHPNATNVVTTTTTAITTNPAAANAVTTTSSTTPLHSPRPLPQLLPPLPTRPGMPRKKSSERVDQLEKMAEVVVRRRSGDLSDLSVGGGLGLGVGVSRVKASDNNREKKEERGGLDVLEGALMRKRTPVGVDKTLPKLQAETVNLGLLNPPSRSGLGLALDIPDNSRIEIARRKSGESDRSGGGRSGAVTPSPKPRAGRILAEDADLQDALRPRSTTESTARTRDAASDSVGGPAPTQPIQIPMKSPEPLNDSAISSLTLAGGLGGDEIQADEFGAGLGLNAVNVGLERGRAKEKEGGGSGSDGDGRTHRGRSRSGGSGSRGSSGSLERDEEGVRSGALKAGGLRMHMRERASGEKLRERERERDAERDRASRGSKESRPSKASKANKPEKAKKTKSAASKGRVAAWLGGIDVGEPPMEEDIPPSPSVLGRFVAAEDDEQEEQEDNKVEEMEKRKNEEKAQTTAPNPRSSGFVPISTLNRSTIILPGHSSTIAGSGLPSTTTGIPPALLTNTTGAGTTPPGGTTPTPKFFYPLWASSTAVTSANARPMSIRTDRRVSPPSIRPMPSVPTKKDREVPMSYSAAAKTSKASSNVPGASTNPTWNDHPIPDSLMNPRPPSFPTKSPAPLDPETKYDIRSARGGRGGKVTAVASLWASGAIAGVSGDKAGNAHPATNGKPALRPKPANLGGLNGHGGVTELGRVKEESLSDEQVAYGASSRTAPPKPTPASKPTTTSTAASGPIKKSFSAALKTPFGQSSTSQATSVSFNPPGTSRSGASTPSSAVNLSKPSVSSARPQTSLGVPSSSKPPPPTAPKPLLRTSVSSSAIKTGGGGVVPGGLTRGDSRGLFGAGAFESATTASLDPAVEKRNKTPTPASRSGKTTPTPGSSTNVPSSCYFQ
ncbi:hypothetical protein CPB83DRAFT_514084 [Crepidotus variabilis]|uniref:Arrestin C-terminal-like domain-containing protein n=1 Tax=Crepidotus variabilis TaxID=179855 RepID=A0A9P6EB24_9AGAR|nr:hypothetical protein CPB83DRAFT_514084 [Crepidotus variabilis]